MRAALEARERVVRERLEDPGVKMAIAGARKEAVAAARLFGSLARGDEFEGFDIDLAVEGIEPGRYFAAWSTAARIVSRKVDLVDVADASPLLRERIEQDGMEL
jgi:predicted nucleotidyltransferase